MTPRVCLICCKDLIPCFDNEHIESKGATPFIGGGHWGSSITDAPEIPPLAVLICDDCFSKVEDRVYVAEEIEKSRKAKVNWIKFNENE